MNNVYIYGEAHFEQESLDFIKNEIIRIKPDILVHELIGNNIVSRKKVVEKLNNCKNGNICDPRINKDIFELAKDLKLTLVGCDLSDKGMDAIKHLSLKEQFKIREANMLSIIKSSLKIGKKNKSIIVVVLGDIHLRDKDTIELGEKSVIWNAVQNNEIENAIIIRCDKKFREV